jgi:hypothetical protein
MLNKTKQNIILQAGPEVSIHRETRNILFAGSGSYTAKSSEAGKQRLKITINILYNIL